MSVPIASKAMFIFYRYRNFAITRDNIKTMLTLNFSTSSLFGRLGWVSFLNWALLTAFIIFCLALVFAFWFNQPLVVERLKIY